MFSHLLLKLLQEIQMIYSKLVQLKTVSRRIIFQINLHRRFPYIFRQRVSLNLERSNRSGLSFVQSQCNTYWLVNLRQSVRSFSELHASGSWLCSSLTLWSGLYDLVDLLIFELFEVNFETWWLFLRSHRVNFIFYIEIFLRMDFFLS